MMLLAPGREENLQQRVIQEMDALLWSYPQAPTQS